MLAFGCQLHAQIDATSGTADVEAQLVDLLRDLQVRRAAEQPRPVARVGNVTVVGDRVRTEPASSLIEAEGRVTATVSRRGEEITIDTDRMSVLRPQLRPDSCEGRVRHSVVLETAIRLDGAFEVLDVVQSFEDRVDEAAIAAVNQWRLEPGPDWPGQTVQLEFIVCGR